MTGTGTLQAVVGRPSMDERVRSVLISGLLTAVGAALWILVFPRIGTDLSAALARANWAERYPGSAYLFSWYGGITPASYSLLAPYLLAVIGTHVAMAAAAILSAMLLTWLVVRQQAIRPAWAALWVAVAIGTELSAGRATFTVALVTALGCVAVVESDRPRPALRLPIVAALAVLTCLISPVAALFLGVIAATFAVVRRWADSAVIAAGVAVPLLIMAAVSDGGIQPAGLNWLPALLAAGAVLLFVPRRWRMVRIATVIYAVIVIATCVFPNPVGSNAARLAELLIGPVLVGIGSSRRRWWLVVALVGAGVWQLTQPVIDLLHGNGPKSTALVAELRVLNADTARVEAVPLYGHWESQELASTVPLARGWERQMDVVRNPIFYRTGFTPAAYHDWLHDNAVRYIAISTAAPDEAAVAEAAIIRAGQPWLTQIWKSANWTLYRVTDATPLASPPATVIGTTPAEIAMRMSAAGTTVIRVHFSPLLRVDGAVVTKDGEWTSMTVNSAGTYVLTAPY